jgi:hypothetical protein
MDVNPISAEAEFCFVFHTSCILKCAKSIASALMGFTSVLHCEMVENWVSFSLPVLCECCLNASKMACPFFQNASKYGISKMK